MNMLNARPIPRACRATMLRRGGVAGVLVVVVNALTASVVALGAAGCGDRDAVRVQLEVQSPPDADPTRLNVRAQVIGPQAGLRYKWFSVTGECEPQESPDPATSFKFALGSTKDRVSVEAWRDAARVARGEIDVTLDEGRARANAAPMPEVKIEITKIPPYNPEGGADTRADIAGRVSGELSPDLKVVVYARADAWYNQPSQYTTHPIRPDNTWATWTHTGSSYAALLVRPGFDPRARLDVLPQVGGYVLARAIIDGAPTSPSTTAPSAAGH
jgi:hypothetical protein